MVIFLLCLHMTEGTSWLSGVSFIRILIPTTRASPSWPNHHPKALLPNTVTFRVRISTCEFQGDTNIQTIAPDKEKLAIALNECTVSKAFIRARAA